LLTLLILLLRLRISHFCQTCAGMDSVFAAWFTNHSTSCNFQNVFRMTSPGCAFVHEFDEECSNSSLQDENGGQALVVVSWRAYLLTFLLHAEPNKREYGVGQMQMIWLPTQPQVQLTLLVQ
jgi:hypothetical protein